MLEKAAKSCSPPSGIRIAELPLRRASDEVRRWHSIRTNDKIALQEAQVGVARHGAPSYYYLPPPSPQPQPHHVYTFSCDAGDTREPAGALPRKFDFSKPPPPPARQPRDAAHCQHCDCPLKSTLIAM